MRRILISIQFAALLAVAAGSALADSPSQVTVVYEGKATELSAASISGDSADLWVTLADLTRATGFELKPQGVCRAELCFPIPNSRRAEFLSQRGGVTLFNLSAFARLLKQPTARDAALDVWYFGPRPEAQNEFLASLEAPNFTLPDVNGKLHSLSDFRGKKVLLVTWASW